jgi:hypothetical protein
MTLGHYGVNYEETSLTPLSESTKFIHFSG